MMKAQGVIRPEAVGVEDGGKLPGRGEYVVVPTWPVPAAEETGEAASTAQRQQLPGSMPVRRTSAKVGSSIFVRYRFNGQNGCSRTPQGQRAVSGKKNGQLLAHNCCAIKADGSHCLGVHIKVNHV